MNDPPTTSTGFNQSPPEPAIADQHTPPRADVSENDTMHTVHNTPSPSADDHLKTQLQQGATTPKSDGYILVERSNKRKKPLESTKSPPSPVTLLAPNNGAQPCQPQQVFQIVRATPVEADAKFKVPQIGKLRMFLFKLIKSNFHLNITREGNLDIFLQNNHAVNLTLALKIIGQVTVTTQLHQPKKQNGTKFVVYNIPSDLTTEDLQEALFDSKGDLLPVNKVHRLSLKDGNPSKSVLFELEGDYEPLAVFLFGQPKAFKTYKEKPKQCSNCLRLGHTAKWCKDLKRCPVCNQTDHPNGQCPNTPKCRNCNGDHRSDDKRNCPKYREKVEVLSVAQMMNLPVPIAALQLAQQKTKAQLTSPQKTPNQAWAPSTCSTPKSTPASYAINFPQLPITTHPLTPGTQVHSRQTTKAKRPTSLAIQGIQQMNPRSTHTNQTPANQNPTTVSSSPTQRHTQPPVTGVPLMLNLTKYTLLYSRLQLANIPAPSKVQILRATSIHYFGQALVDEVEYDLSAILNQINVHLPNEA